MNRGTPFGVEEFQGKGSASSMETVVTGLAPFSGTFGLEEPNMVTADDVDDYDGQTFSPPIDAGGNALSDLSAFTQQITVENVSKTDLAQVVADHSSDFVRITVTVSQNNQNISAASWIRARY